MTSSIDATAMKIVELFRKSKFETTQSRLHVVMMWSTRNPATLSSANIILRGENLFRSTIPNLRHEMENRTEPAQYYAVLRLSPISVQYDPDV